jgi:serine O-acetyltransferase
VLSVVTAVLHHRVAHELYKLGAPLVARIIAEIAHSRTGIDIHPGATIGEASSSTTAPAW